MERLIERIVELIGDYREDQLVLMNRDVVLNWINQFLEGDREFILTELVNIFEKRYISKIKAKEIVKGMIDYLMHINKYDDAKAFLADTIFIDNQREGKSQKELLAFLEVILNENFDFSLSQCGSVSNKFCVYLDDILCTGETVYNSLAKEDGWLYQLQKDGKSNLGHIVDKSSKLYFAYFAVHMLNFRKVVDRIGLSVGEDIDVVAVSTKQYKIDNNYINPQNSSLEFIFPIERDDDDVLECKAQIENKVLSYQRKNNFKESKPYFFRQNSLPVEEVLFTSVDNRNRFETIILDKCIEVYNRANREEGRMRPLGYGLRKDISFGFGALIFTWRNVAFNTPMVFWYEHRGWVPLFKRNFT